MVGQDVIKAFCPTGICNLMYLYLMSPDGD